MTALYRRAAACVPGRRIGRALALAVWGLVAAAPAFGQTSGLAPDAPTVEMYSGVRRVPDPRVKKVEPPPLLPKDMTRAPEAPVMPLIIEPSRPAEPDTLPHAWKADDTAVVKAGATAFPAGGTATALTPAAFPTSVAAPATVDTFDVSFMGDWTDTVPWLHGETGRMVVLMTGGGSGLVGIGTFLMMLMRWFGPVIRVQFVGGLPQLAVAGVAQVPAGPQGPVTALHRSSDAAVPNFELGPTYEEEQAQHALAAQHQEQGVLQHVFERNVELLAEIDKMYGPALAPETPPTTPAAGFQEPIHVG